jgi:hypothetical protein
MPATTQRQKIEAIEFWGVCVTSHAFMARRGEAALPVVLRACRQIHCTEHAEHESNHRQGRLLFSRLLDDTVWFVCCPQGGDATWSKIRRPSTRRRGSSPSSSAGTIWTRCVLVMSSQRLEALAA